MRFMNSYDVEEALRRYGKGDTPNLHHAAQTIQRLMDWANSVSDGWAYWPKPARSAAKLMELIEGNGTWEAIREREENDVTETALRAALRPIKAMLTKTGIEGAHDIVFPPAADVDLPVGYRWMTAEETEWYCSRPVGVGIPNVIVVKRTVDSSGRPYTQDEADLAIRI